GFTLGCRLNLICFAVFLSLSVTKKVYRRFMLVCYMTALICEGSSAVLHCPQESVINIQSAFYGRKSDDICPHLDGSTGKSHHMDLILLNTKAIKTEKLHLANHLLLLDKH
uniref:Uncharacterized protein n=1 Tax=Labrus bergylta TaxID=56723 RepID=A0A3Q3MN78_9LABR